MNPIEYHVIHSFTALFSLITDRQEWLDGGVKKIDSLWAGRLKKGLLAGCFWALLGRWLKRRKLNKKNKTNCRHHGPLLQNLFFCFFLCFLHFWGIWIRTGCGKVRVSTICAALPHPSCPLLFFWISLFPEIDDSSQMYPGHVDSDCSPPTHQRCTRQVEQGEISAEPWLTGMRADRERYGYLWIDWHKKNVFPTDFAANDVYVCVFYKINRHTHVRMYLFIYTYIYIYRICVHHVAIDVYKFDIRMYNSQKHKTYVCATALKTQVCLSPRDSFTQDGYNPPDYWLQIGY